MPVLFTAKADAPLAGDAGRRSTGKPADPKLERPLRVHADRRSWSSGQNNVTVWTRTVDRLAVAVTEECPVLDRDRRAQGAAGPGRLDGPEGRREAQAGLHGADRGLPALEPAGRRLGRAASRSPRGRTRPSIPMNADGGAELRTWKIVVNGASGVAERADHGLVAAGQPDDRRAVRRRSTFQAASVEQGKETDLVVKVDQGRRLPRRGAGRR